MKMFKISVVALALFAAACATTQLQRARQVDVNVHASIAGLDDAELALCAPDAQHQCHSVVPTYTTAVHQQVRKHITTMLKAGNALNDMVLQAPVSPAAKADLATVSMEVQAVSDIIKPLLPPGNVVLTWIDTVTADVLKLLPLFLQ